ncbi:bifunctional adenosylcobinamide kinase/adenosylcobinamide-phosphate guanylyltransferase [Massilia sp. Root335]|uniref:bifunctional adenosylcobinamide kinase/adenosylcobinamide-phosphate guanylyltransferase n=1 Tax=Massilia sp. Root335 TaxID=1736517 RepID=UPI0006FFB9FB|nr:bifunctional adenosylcobinamide kinase/adenosylcobinamide-phosphate guanylyltransferase [Massilia sp. Root335]KQV41484.1 adenosylcobinamide kinase/adenosylcobinamide phosphate guanyltransferase [Massilia sp. Root335]
MTRTLVLGGARSGKSALAERLARESGKEVIYLATSHAGDAEMAARIAHHRARRPAGWQTVEEATALAATLRTLCAPGRIVLVDCLTLWLTNLMFATRQDVPDVGPIALPPLFGAERAALMDWLDAPSAGDVVFVSNEVGMGIVPYGAVSRAFVDEAGRLNQDVAARCDRVLFVAAGLPLALKGAPC